MSLKTRWKALTKNERTMIIIVVVLVVLCLIRLPFIIENVGKIFR